MTYIELINRFWEIRRVKSFSDIDTVVYFFLLNECNIKRWLNPFELQTRNLEAELQISRKTIGEARNRLKQRGLIDFVEAKGRGATRYLIMDAEITNPDIYELFCVSLEKHKGNTKGVCVSLGKLEGNTKGNTKVTQEEHKGNATADSTLYNEDKRYKTKDNTIVRARAKREPDDSLFSSRELDIGKAKGVRARTPGKFTPPTINEVNECFLHLNADQRIQAWETEAMSLYCYYGSQGWVKASGREILSLELIVNDWILRKEKEQKQSKSNESTTAYRRTSPEDAFADDQQRLAQRVQSRQARQKPPDYHAGDSDLPF